MRRHFLGKLSTDMRIKYGGVAYKCHSVDSGSGHVCDLRGLGHSEISQGNSVPIDRSFFLFLIKTHAKSGDWEQIRITHNNIVQCGQQLDAFLCSSLIDIYMKSGSLNDAFSVFSSVCFRDTVMMNAMMKGYADHGDGERALIVFSRMVNECMIPNQGAFVVVLKVCGVMGNLNQGMRIHTFLFWCGLGSNMHVSCSLIDMYGKCHRLDNARQVFESIHQPDVVLWNVLIMTHAEYGRVEEDHKFHNRMQQEGVIPNNITILGMLKACSKRSFLKNGRHLHSLVVGSALISDLNIMNTLIDMYAKSHCLMDARIIFDFIHVKSIVSWNVMLMGYIQEGLNMEVIILYISLLECGISPNTVTYTTVLKASVALAASDFGRNIHTVITQNGITPDVNLTIALIKMYAASNCIEDAEAVFNLVEKKTTAIWNSVMSTYSEQGFFTKAIDLFGSMQQGVGVDKFTYIIVINTCRETDNLELGHVVHAQVVGDVICSENFIATSLVDLYTKCGSLTDACYIFENLHQKDVASWTTMISGYCSLDMWREAAVLFKRMQREGLRPDRVAFLTIIKICGKLRDPEWCNQIYEDVFVSGLHTETGIRGAVIDMYIKCDSVDLASRMFKKMDECNVVSWNAMIAGYVHQGKDKEALQLFDNMYQTAVHPDNSSFISALRSYSAQGALKKGKQIDAQLSISEVELPIELTNSLLDMYIKCGSTDHACQLFERLTDKTLVTWNIMIAGYAQHGLGQESLSMFERMVMKGVEPDDITFSSVLSACTHDGLILEAYYLFSLFYMDYDVHPSLEHYTFIVDMLGRAGCLNYAKAFVDEIPKLPDIMTWMSLFGTCKSHQNAMLAEYVFAFVVELEEQSSSAK